MNFFDRQNIFEALIRNRVASEHSHESLKENDKHTDKKETRKRKRERKKKKKKKNEKNKKNKDSVLECSKNNEFEDDVQTLRNYLFLFVDTN